MTWENQEKQNFFQQEASNEIENNTFAALNKQVKLCPTKFSKLLPKVLLLP